MRTHLRLNEPRRRSVDERRVAEHDRVTQQLVAIADGDRGRAHIDVDDVPPLSRCDAETTPLPDGERGGSAMLTERRAGRVDDGTGAGGYALGRERPRDHHG